MNTNVIEFLGERFTEQSCMNVAEEIATLRSLLNRMRLPENPIMQVMYGWVHCKAQQKLEELELLQRLGVVVVGTFQGTPQQIQEALND